MQPYDNLNDASCNYVQFILHHPVHFNNDVERLLMPAVEAEVQHAKFIEFKTEVIKLFKQIYEPEYKKNLFHMILSGSLTEFDQKKDEIERFLQLEKKYLTFTGDILDKLNKQFRSEFQIEFDYLLYHIYIGSTSPNALLMEEFSSSASSDYQNLLGLKFDKAIKNVLKKRATFMAEFECRLQQMAAIEKYLGTTFPYYKKQIQHNAYHIFFELDHLVVSYSPFFSNSKHTNKNLENGDLYLLRKQQLQTQLPVHLSKFYYNCYMAELTYHRIKTKYKLKPTAKNINHYVSMENVLKKNELKS